MPGGHRRGQNVSERGRLAQSFLARQVARGRSLGEITALLYFIYYFCASFDEAGRGAVDANVDVFGASPRSAFGLICHIVGCFVFLFVFVVGAAWHFAGIDAPQLGPCLKR